MVKPTVSVVLLVLAGQARGAELTPGDCVGEGRALEVKVGAALGAVCVSAGSSVVLDFESSIIGERTEADGGVEPFTGVGAKSVALMTPGMDVGERGRVTVYFADGFEPASATFAVVVVPGPTQPRAKVLRQPRTAASLREEVEDLARRLAQCESSGQTPSAGGPAGVLPGLLAQDDSVVTLLPWTRPRDYVVRPGFEGSLVGVLKTLLLPGGGGKPEAAVFVHLHNTGAMGWEVEEATLVSISGEALARVRTLTRVVVGPGDTVPFYVVSEPTLRAVPGVYTLKLRGRGREFVLENVTFK